MKTAFVLTSVLLGSMLPGSHTRQSTYNNMNTARFRTDAAGPVGSVYIIIDKSEYALSVYDEEGWYATYPVVFGSDNQGDKKMEGDKKTPEGVFKINAKRVHDKWSRFLSIDYPNEESRRKFNLRKGRGEIPANAKIGGSIGIHGTWPNEDFVVDRYKNWTLGCISMKRSEVEEIYGFVKLGTRVIIQK
jgi:murein L,D-transpeptidase YafK